MNKISIEISDIPHGHGLSFKKGLADALPDNRDNESSCHETQLASYNKGRDAGATVAASIAKHVKA